MSPRDALYIVLSLTLQLDAIYVADDIIIDLLESTLLFPAILLVSRQTDFGGN